MLDWFQGYVGYDASQIDFGRVLIFDPSGEVVRESPRWETARSSHETTIQVSSTMPTPAMLEHSQRHGFHCSQGPILRMSGNPAKYLQGHNVFGPSSAQLGPVLQHLVKALPDELRPFDVEVSELPAVHRSTLDTNVTIDLEDHATVHNWITTAAKSTRSYSGRAQLVGQSTVYWQKNSKRWSLKAYCKHCELKANRPNVTEDVYSDLLEYTKGKLRLELRLRRLELKDRGTIHEDIIWDFYDKIVVGVANEDVIDLRGLNMNDREKMALKVWSAYMDPAEDLSRPTFYRYRKTILQETGIDIKNLREPSNEEHSNVLRKMFEKDYLRPRVISAPPRRLRKHLLQVS